MCSRCEDCQTVLYEGNAQMAMLVRGGVLTSSKAATSIGGGGAHGGGGKRAGCHLSSPI